MLFNYIKIALRQLYKNKVFSIINITGLTLGFLCFIILGLYVHDELSFDTFHKDADRTYRVLQHEKQDNGEDRHVASIAAQVGPNLKAQFPEVEDVLRIYSIGRSTMGNDPALRNYEITFTADSNFFNFFDFVLLEGNPATALTKPNSVVLSESTAKKYFSNTSAFGKTIRVNEIDMEITGILKDMPSTSSLNLPLLFSHKTWLAQSNRLRQIETSDWTSNIFTTYVKLRPDADLKQVESKLTTLVKEHYGPEDEFKSTFSLQPIAAMHVNGLVLQGNDQTGAPSIAPFYIYMFIAIAFLILLIACLNYMNLSTAAAFKRTREIGTRKVMGAFRSQLISQFTGEALILSGFALALALILLQVVLPFVNNFTNKDLHLTHLQGIWLPSMVLTMLGIGILAALYPAFIIARVSPAEALKKELRIANRSFPIRKVLIAAQFTISIVMITSTLIIYNQLQFMRSKDMGVNVEDLLVIDINSRNLRRNFEAIKTEFSALSEVSSVSVSSRVPGEWKSYPIASVLTGGNIASTDMIFVGADKDFFKTYNIELLQGRNFTDALADSSKVILSSLAVKQLGLTDPLGQIIEIPTARFGGNVVDQNTPFRAEVIGVINDFHFQSLREAMMPLVIGFWNNPIQSIDYYTLKINLSNFDETLTKLREVNAKFDTENPVEYNILSDRFEEFYRTDAQRGQLFLLFSCIIVFIACLGLFALVSYAVESRTKEIGVRKVLGASVGSIVTMVSKEFLLLVLIAFVIASPVAYLFMQRWLQDFAYKTNVGIGTFAIAGGIAFIIALLTVSIRSMKAAVVNPVKSLRSE